MRVHPVIAGIVLVLLGALAVYVAATDLTLGTFVAAGLITTALVLWGFYPDALTARRLIEEAIRHGVPDRPT